MGPVEEAGEGEVVGVDEGIWEGEEGRGVQWRRSWRMKVVMVP